MLQIPSPLTKHTPSRLAPSVYKKHTHTHSQIKSILLDLCNHNTMDTVASYIEYPLAQHVPKADPHRGSCSSRTSLESHYVIANYSRGVRLELREASNELFSPPPVFLRQPRSSRTVRSLSLSVRATLLIGLRLASFPLTLRPDTSSPRPLDKLILHLYSCHPMTHDHPGTFKTPTQRTC